MEVQWWMKKEQGHCGVFPGWDQSFEFAPCFETVGWLT